MPEGGQVNLHDGPSRPGPLPTRSSRGEGDNFWAWFTQAPKAFGVPLGYYQAIPAGFQYG